MGNNKTEMRLNKTVRFWKIQRMKIKRYPKMFIGTKFDTFYFKKKSLCMIIQLKQQQKSNPPFGQMYHFGPKQTWKPSFIVSLVFFIASFSVWEVFEHLGWGQVRISGKYSQIWRKYFTDLVHPGLFYKQRWKIFEAAPCLNNLSWI